MHSFLHEISTQQDFIHGVLKLFEEFFKTFTFSGLQKITDIQSYCCKSQKHWCSISHEVYTWGPTTACEQVDYNR
jgi:hypothetical protein